MSGVKAKYYWDSCIFLAWLRNENRKEGEMEAVKALVRQLQQGEIAVFTSAIMYTEVKAIQLPVGAIDQFYSLLRGSQVVTISTDVKIAKLAGDLREYYYTQRKHNDGKTLYTPDAIHLATAILYGATEFHTFDASNRKSLGLLPLDGNVGGHDLRICIPETRQTELKI